MKFINNINNVWRKKQRSSADENWSTYLFFAVLRMVLVFIPQLGYVHPDEHFQSVEIINGTKLNSNNMFLKKYAIIRGPFSIGTCAYLGI